MSKRANLIEGLISECVLTNKLTQRVMYTILTEDLVAKRPETFPADEIQEIISFFKAAQEHLNHMLDRFACIRLGCAGNEESDYAKRMFNQMSPEYAKARIIGTFDGQELERKD